MDSRGVPVRAGNSGTDILKPEEACEILFERILDQLADSSLFSSGLSPTIFVVYAHNNEKVGSAYDEFVRKLITWLERVHVQILSDHSPLPPFVPSIDGTDPMGNILDSQMCLLPPSCYRAETPKIETVDKVVVCGSEVLEAYCREPTAWTYINEIARVCTYRTGQPTGVTLETAIRQRVEKQCNSNNFHHVLTELAFLQARKSDLSDTHGMVPVVLSQNNPDEAPMKYLPVFWNTDVKLKLSSPAVSSLHKLFFKLLKQLFPDDKEFIQPFQECYDLVIKDLRLDGKVVVTRHKFDHIVNKCITKAYQQFWKAFCVIVRDEKLRAYIGKLSDQVSQSMEDVAQSTQHDILQWLSRHPASMHHGIYHDSGTARLLGTCDWVIQDEEFCRWYTCEGSALLFLCGNMGTGKTYATSRVIDWVKEGLSTNDNNEAFAYFYCNKQDPARSEPKEILRNIIRQLAIGPGKDQTKNTVVHKSVHNIWLKARGQGILSTFSEWEACLIELVDTYPRTTIVLDALDECKMQQRQDLINLLIKLATREADTMAVKIFVSARPEDDICRHLENYQLIRMQEQHNAKDIAHFIRAKLEEHRRWPKISDDLQKEMVTKLLEKSGDMFLFASLQIQQLRNCNTQSALRKRLSTLPNSLSKIYEEIYDRETLDYDERKFLQRALLWVLCSARPLTTDELLFAVSQDSESDSVKSRNQELDEEMMLLWTQNLLSLDDSPRGAQQGPPVWRLAHQAVADFLENSTWCNSGLAHCAIGKVCLMMVLDAFGANTNENRINTDEELEYGQDFKCPCKPITSDNSRVHRPLPNTLLEYAFHGWPTHVREQEDSVACNVDGLSRTLQKFLGQPDKGSLVYKRWLDHAYISSFVPRWSIFRTRPMPSATVTDTAMMTPMTLACHLGIYTCLLEWWSRANIDYDWVFDPLSVWSPAIVWSRSSLSHRWSLIALACVHCETNIIKHLLGGNVQINTKANDDVPPIVAAAVAGSLEGVKELLDSGADVFSSFNDPRGNLLWVAIDSNSLGLMRILLQHTSLSQALEVERVLESLDYRDFKSADTMEMLVEMGVNVNTPLNVGTLLLAAVEGGWENMVCSLLEKGAETNPQDVLGQYGTVLETAFKDGRPSLSIITQLINHGAHVSSRPVGWVLGWIRGNRSSDDITSLERIVQLLLGCKPDLDETYSRGYTGETSALIEAVKDGGLDHARLLFEHGAKVNLNVEGKYGNALGGVFQGILDPDRRRSYLDTHAMINALVEEGASLQNLKGDRLHTALAAAAFAGLEDMVGYFLYCGADPNAKCGHQYHTALGAAAASEHPRGLDILRTLLSNDSDMSTDYGFFQTARFALDGPLYRMLGIRTPYFEPHPQQPLDAWLQSATVLATHHAVWDIDFTQWNMCLKLRNPWFVSRNFESLVKLQQMLADNRTNFFLKFPEATSMEEWSIKKAKDHEPDERSILRRMKGIFGG